MSIYTILSRLLDYPDQELKDNLALLHQGVDLDQSLREEERETVRDLLAHIHGQSLDQLQEDYVRTFDLTPEHSLHLTHHLFGDDRGRGPALVELGEHFGRTGLALKKGEIPDHLPLILEYLGTLDDTEAGAFLADAAKVLRVLAANLEKSVSHYAPVVRLIESRGHAGAALEEKP